MSVTELPLGRQRAIQQCTQEGGTFAMLAMDQRGSLKRALRPEDPGAVTFEEMAAIKEAVVGAISPHASATLLDPEYGYPVCVPRRALSGHSGLLLALEATGYEGQPTERRTRLLENWSPERMRKAGASGVKLLVYYHPEAANAQEQEALVAQVAEECHRWDLPLFLEPIHYSLDPSTKRVPNPERRRVVIETARRLVPLGVDVLKAEFPVDVAQTQDEIEWADACAELSEASAVPWVLLSAGVDYDTFYRQLRVACENGASGMLCGRAIWKESVGLRGAERTAFLRTTGVERIRRLAALIRGLARPFWSDR